MIPYKQLSVEDIFQDCQDIFENNKLPFLSLLGQVYNDLCMFKGTNPFLRIQWNNCLPDVPR